MLRMSIKRLTSPLPVTDKLTDPLLRFLEKSPSIRHRCGHNQMSMQCLFDRHRRASRKNIHEPSGSYSHKLMIEVADALQLHDSAPALATGLTFGRGRPGIL